MQYQQPMKYPAAQHHDPRPQAQAQAQALEKQSDGYAGAELGTDAPQPSELASQQPSHIATVELAAQQRVEMAASPVPVAYYSQEFNTKVTAMDRLDKR